MIRVVPAQARSAAITPRRSSPHADHVRHRNLHHVPTLPLTPPQTTCSSIHTSAIPARRARGILHTLRRHRCVHNCRRNGISTLIDWVPLGSPPRTGPYSPHALGRPTLLIAHFWGFRWHLFCRFCRFCRYTFVAFRVRLGGPLLGTSDLTSVYAYGDYKVQQIGAFFVLMSIGAVMERA